MTTETSSSTRGLTLSDICSRLQAAGQEHVLQYVEDLTEGDRQALLQQLDSIQVDQIESLYQTALAHDTAATTGDDDIKAIQPFSGPVGKSSDDNSSTWRATGMAAIATGQVAALVLAGGQGTRLGYDGPKGMYNIGLPSQRTLFQLIAERLLKLRKLASTGGERTECSLPFYIMTSPLNHQVTVDYFAEHNYFGLGSDTVFFFQQGMLPCLTEDGKMILESKCQVAMAPDGNGGIYPSLQSSGALRDMEDRGVQYIHVFSIDNALTKPADPVFVGYCISQQADCGNKVVWKAHAHEKVGVMASKANQPCIVEYSEITTEMAERVEASSGSLVFGAANICNHFYTMDFLQNTILPNMSNLYHVARKKIPYYDPVRNQTTTPESTNNGVKLETFIFDVFPLSQRMALFEVDRDDEFAPVKNSAGSPTDSPDTARTMISHQAKRWVISAGGKLSGKDDDENICEIAPRTSYAGEGLESLVQDKDIPCPFFL